jgi:hypothetical protein
VLWAGDEHQQLSSVSSWAADRGVTPALCHGGEGGSCSLVLWAGDEQQQLSSDSSWAADRGATPALCHGGEGGSCSLVWAGRR